MAKIPKVLYLQDFRVFFCPERTKSVLNNFLDENCIINCDFHGNCVELLHNI